MTSSNSTLAYLGSMSAWAGASLEFRDFSYQSGGCRIFIYGTGHTVVQIIEANRQETRYTFNTNQTELKRLWQTCIQHDLARIKPGTQSTSNQPTNYQSIKLVNYLGHYCDISRLPGIENVAFEAIVAEFRHIAAHIQQVKPTYRGPLQEYYRPNRRVKGLVWHIRKFMTNLTNIERRDVSRFLLEVILALINHWPLLLLSVISLVIAYFWVVIDPQYIYGFGSALLHGLFWGQNAILSLFTSRETRAPLNTGWSYTTGFIIGMVVIPFMLRTIIQIIAILLGRDGR